MRAIGFFSQSFFSISLILTIVTLKPDHLAIAFKGQNVRRNTIQKPAIVSAHHGTAAKPFKALFQGP